MPVSGRGEELTHVRGISRVGSGALQRVLPSRDRLLVRLLGRQLGRVGSAVWLDDIPDEAPHPLALFALALLVPAGAAVYALAGEPRIDLLVHHAKVAATAVAEAQAEELGMLQAQALERLLPVLGEVIHLQPQQHLVHGPLGDQLGRDAAEGNGIGVAGGRRGAVVVVVAAICSGVGAVAYARIVERRRQLSRVGIVGLSPQRALRGGGRIGSDVVDAAQAGDAHTLAVRVALRDVGGRHLLVGRRRRRRQLHVLAGGGRRGGVHGLALLH